METGKERIRRERKKGRKERRKARGIRTSGTPLARNFSISAICVEVKRVGVVVARVTIRERKRTKEMRDRMVRRAIVAGWCLEREVLETEGWFRIEEWFRDGRLYIQNREEEAGRMRRTATCFRQPLRSGPTQSSMKRTFLKWRRCRNATMHGATRHVRIA